MSDEIEQEHNLSTVVNAEQGQVQMMILSRPK